MHNVQCTKLMIVRFHYNINVQYAMCSVQCAVMCSVQFCAVCSSVQCAKVFSMQYAVVCNIVQ